MVVASVSAASAHAVVTSSQPTDGERLPTAPTSVTFQFTEPVKADLGGLKVVDANGHRVDTGPTRTSGNSLTTSLQNGLLAGTYVASYRVISADSHPIKGAIVFAVGDASATGVNISALSGGASQDRSFEFLGAISRFLAYAGALTAAGLGFFLVFVHDGGSDGHPLARIVRGAALLGAIGAIGATAAQAALATGRGWEAVFDVGVIHQVLLESLDWANLVLLAGLALVLTSLEARRRGARQALAFYGGMATTLSFVFSGHSTTAPDPWIAIGSNGVHVIAAALWLGGLIGLGVVLVARTRAIQVVAAAEADSETPAPTNAPIEPVAVGTTLMVTEQPITSAAVDRLRATALIVARFSTVALVSVIALGLAGSTMAWVELGSLGALTSTTYGRLVLVKISIVLVIAALAAYNRQRLVPEILGDIDLAGDLASDQSGDLTNDESDPAAIDRGANDGDAGRDVITAQPDTWATEGLRRLARTVIIEVLAILAVLGVTSVLVNTTPGRNAVGDVGAVNQTLPVTTSTDGSTLNLVVAPAQSGVNAIHLSYYDPNRRPITISGPVKIELTLPSADIGPISRDPLPAGPGHYILNDADLSPAGLWTITVITRTSEFDQVRTAFTVKIR
jgi:copper transport protein